MLRHRVNLGAAKAPVLSLGVLAQSSTIPRKQSQFEVLVRHLLHRFFHNELLTSDDETKRIMQISYCVALPGLLYAMFQFSSYHPIPPAPDPKPYWAQMGDHYFYVMYSLLLMGAATVYEWDLLFPDLLDVFVLSVLPISNRRLFLARVLALVLFLAVVQFGTSAFGIAMLPMVADQPHTMRQMGAHAFAVTMSGAFASAFFLALQGTLINIFGERFVRRISPIVQSGSLMILLSVLLLYPTLSRSMEGLLTSGSKAVAWFPPFWFLGAYERVFYGPTVLPVFTDLAKRGTVALLLALSVALLTYPLAYRRRVRQLIEGSSASIRRGVGLPGLNALLHATIIRSPAQRATFHFAAQTVLRSQRHRVMLAMYAGLGISIAFANMFVLHINDGRIRPALMAGGIRAAALILVFWTIVGLHSAVAAPVDRRGAWVFRALLGRAKRDHLAGTRMWVAMWGAMVGIGSGIALRLFSPASLKTPGVIFVQICVVLGLSILLSDLFLYGVRSVPFTHLRISSITDFPLMIIRYVVLFPLLISLVLHFEAGFESSIGRFIGGALFLTGLHLLILRLHSTSQDVSELPPSETETFPQSLGLIDT